MGDAARPLALIAAIAAAAACARPLPPPGGERDTTPPGLVGTTPAPLAVVRASAEPVVFRFDERLSERGFSPALVTVSPLDSTLRVHRARTEVRVRLDGGWRPNRVYRVVLLPGLRDLFGNTRTAPVELVFSTGPPVTDAAIAGLVLDRITGSRSESAVVEAVHRGDSIRYTAISDSAGFYSLRHLPLGSYFLRAYADQNRNRRLDSGEPADSGNVELRGPADTVPLIFRVLAPDTSAPRVVRAEALDSVRVRVVLDDYVDPAVPFTSTAAEVHALPDSTSFAVSTRIEAATTAVLRPRGPDRVRGDTLRAQPDTAPTGPPVPTRDLIVELNRPLQPDASYTITVTNIVNISGLTGWGVARFTTPRTPPPPPPDTAAAPRDTLAVPRDTLPVPRDTLTVPRDTLTVPRDTLAVPRDTLAVPRDTLRPPPDTLRLSRRSRR